ncbi:MAG: hypothetical protein U0842_26300 [Candidatus Binatia bacterium]
MHESIRVADHELGTRHEPIELASRLVGRDAEVRPRRRMRTTVPFSITSSSTRSRFARNREAVIFRIDTLRALVLPSNVRAVISRRHA